MKSYKIENDSLVEINFKQSLEDEQNKYWLILSPDELEENISFFGFNNHTLYDCMYNEDSPKIEMYENYSFGIINMMGENFTKDYELDFYLTKKYLIFISKYDLNIINEIKNDIANKGVIGLSLDKILYILFDKLTFKDYNILSKLEVEISEVEEDVLHGKTKDYINDIVSLKKKLLIYKKHYEPLLDIIEDIAENENNILDDKAVTYFKILFNRIERLNRKVGNLRDYVTQIRESYQAQIDNNTNNIMKILTVITSIFLPLSLIAGWYGMNFTHMPELHWKFGYLYIIILSVLIVAISLYIFKKKKWL